MPIGPLSTRRRLIRLQHSVDKLHRTIAKSAITASAGEGARAHVVQLDYPGADIHLQAMTRHEHKRAFACRKEPWTVAWIESAPAGGVLWDVGANVGAYSLIAAMRPQGAMQVVSIEPSFSTYASLCRNVLLNGVADRISPLCAMLGDVTGTGTLGYADTKAGASFHAGGAASLKEDFASEFDQKVFVFRLDELVERFGLPAPDFLKIDVDGAEVQVLHGARETLRTVSSVLLEISDREREEIAPLMEEAGLRMVGDEHRRTGPKSEAAASPGSVGYARYDRAA